LRPLPYSRHAATRGRQFGAVAQLGERLHGMQEVVGSSPISSTSTRLTPRNVEKAKGRNDQRLSRKPTVVSDEVSHATTAQPGAQRQRTPPLLPCALCLVPSALLQSLRPQKFNRQRRPAADRQIRHRFAD